MVSAIKVIFVSMGSWDLLPLHSILLWDDMVCGINPCGVVEKHKGCQRLGFLWEKGEGLSKLLCSWGSF